jgi:hypothetical protein
VKNSEYPLEISNRTCGWQRRKEALNKKTATFLQIIDRVWHERFDFSFVFFDSWFAYYVITSKVVITYQSLYSSNTFSGWGLIESTCRYAPLSNFTNRWLRTTTPYSQPSFRLVNGYMAKQPAPKTCYCQRLLGCIGDTNTPGLSTQRICFPQRNESVNPQKPAGWRRPF